MRLKESQKKDSAEKAVRDIRRATRRRFAAEEKIRIVLEGLRGEESIAELCRKEGICTTAGQRSFLRPARSAWPVIRYARRVRMR